MKAPTYILKRIYLERNQERELSNHEKRLNSINALRDNALSEVRKQTKLFQEQQDQIKKIHDRAIEYRNFDRKRQQFFSDQVLVKKLISTSLASPPSTVVAMNHSSVARVQTQPNTRSSRKRSKKHKKSLHKTVDAFDQYLPQDSDENQQTTTLPNLNSSNVQTQNSRPKELNKISKTQKEEYTPSSNQQSNSAIQQDYRFLQNNSEQLTQTTEKQHNDSQLQQQHSQIEHKQQKQDQNLLLPQQQQQYLSQQQQQNQQQQHQQSQQHVHQQQQQVQSENTKSQNRENVHFAQFQSQTQQEQQKEQHFSQQKEIQQENEQIQKSKPRQNQIPTINEPQDQNTNRNQAIKTTAQSLSVERKSNLQSSKSALGNYSSNQPSIASQKINNSSLMQKQTSAANSSGFYKRQSRSISVKSSDNNGTNPNYNSINSVNKRKEEERIQMENFHLANRMLHLPPVISKKKLESDYQKNKVLGQNILRFHHYRKKLEKDYEEGDKISFEKDEFLDGIDVNNRELMDQKVQLVLIFKKVSFINFLPRNAESEKYYMEIKASIRASRKTTPEMYDDFAKATVNEFFYLHELRKSKIMQVGLYQQKDGKENFLGDFEIDLAPFYLEGISKPTTVDLRNFKELNRRPAYMTTDMRRKGTIDIDLKVTSNIKEYLLDKNNVKTELAPTMNVKHKTDSH